MTHWTKTYNDPFLFAIPHSMPTTDRAQVPPRIAKRYGVEGRVEFVSADDRMRLYQVRST